MDKPTLTKTCRHCGLQKPLSAFLQIAGARGSTYGNICASCRKIIREKMEKPKEPEDSTTSKTGARIDSKTKVQSEIEKRKERQRIEELYRDEKENEDKRQEEKDEKTQQITLSDKRRREEYEKRSFLDSANMAKRVTFTQPMVGSDEQIAEAGKVDSTAATHDTAVAGKVKYTQSAIFKSFVTRIGLGTSIGRAFENRIEQKKSAEHKAESKEHAATKTESKEHPTSKTESKEHAAGKETSLKEKHDSIFKHLKSWIDHEKKNNTSNQPSEDFVQKTWGPSSKK